MAGQKDKGGGASKYGRNKKHCERYRARLTKERNKRRKLAKHVIKFPNDKAAAAALVKLDTTKPKAA